jgi:hypothetical protein
MALVRGFVVSFDAGSHTAHVRLEGSSPQRLEGIAVARNIAAAEVTAGRRLLLDTGESGEVEDLVVYAVFV